MILDLAGNKKEAGKRFEHAYKLDSYRAARGRGLWQLAVAQQPPKEALDVFEAFDKVLPRHPLMVEAMNKLKAGEKLPPLVDTPQAGAAEALYGLGASLGRRGGEDLGLVYLQLALYLAPNHPLALLSLADLYESLKKPELAIKVYERMPANSPLHRNAAIQMAANLDALDRTDEAEKHLEALIKEHPDDLEAIMALGNILRGRKKFAECADVYSKGIATIAQPDKANWVIFYFRGICYERSQAVAEGGSRSQEGARAVSRAAARAQLSRLFLGRPGHQPRRGHGHDQARRRSSGRTTATSSTRSAGPISASAITTRRSSSSSARSSSSRKTRPSTIISATPIGASAARWRRNSSGRMRAISSPIRKTCRRSRPSCKDGLPDETSSQAKAEPRRRAATAAKAAA